MTRTGWIEDPERPAMQVTELLLGRQQRRAGPLETALARSRATDIREAREAAASAPDPDERAAGFVARGYAPGLLQELMGRLGDTEAEIEAENAKIEKAARRAQFAAREHLAHKLAADAAGRAAAATGQRLQYQAFGEGVGRIEGAVRVLAGDAA